MLRLQGSNRIDWKSDRVSCLRQIDSYLHLTEDREPRPHQLCPRQPLETGTDEISDPLSSSWGRTNSWYNPLYGFSVHSGSCVDPSFAESICMVQYASECKRMQIHAYGTGYMHDIVQP